MNAKIDRDIRDRVINSLAGYKGSRVRLRGILSWSDRHDYLVMKNGLDNSVKTKGGRFWHAFYGVPAGELAALDILEDAAIAKATGND